MRIQFRTLIVRQILRRAEIRKASLRDSVWPFVFAALIVCAPSLYGEGTAPVSASPRHVLVISIDGLSPSYYLNPSPSLRIPNLLRLKQEGSFAEGVVGVYPSVTYPSHTTMVTGRLPAEHGVYSNLSSREPGKNAHEWYWYSRAIKVTALWDEARHHHLATAAVSWPVTVGAAIDWNVPEVREPRKGEKFDVRYVRENATPGMVEEAVATLGESLGSADDDTRRTLIAAYILKKYKPNLMLVHLVNLDSARHGHGPQSVEANSTLERIDVLIGNLLAAVHEARIEDSTSLFIVSDHGFLPVEHEIRPNVLLVKAGLLRADDQGSITGGRVATIANGGSFFIYWPEGEDLRSEVDVALKPLRDQKALWSVLDRQALEDLGAEPAAQMALEAPEGATFSSQAAGEPVSKRKALGGTHGYLPFRRGLEAAFIAWGPRIKSGVNLHRIRMTALGATILKDLGIHNPQFGVDGPLTDIFK